MAMANAKGVSTLTFCQPLLANRVRRPQSSYLVLGGNVAARLGERGSGGGRFEGRIAMWQRLGHNGLHRPHVDAVPCLAFVGQRVAREVKRLATRAAPALPREAGCTKARASGSNTVRILFPARY